MRDGFLLYYTARDRASGKQCVGVAFSPRPEGSFTDSRGAPLVCQAKLGGTIDPSPFRDGDRLYLLFKNDGNCCGLTAWLWVQEMTSDGQGLVGDPVKLASNDRPWEGRVVEAPTLVKHEDRYYLFYSANNYSGPEYAVGYALCESVSGPCQDAPENPILKSNRNNPAITGPGHQTLLRVEDHWWIIFHAWEPGARGIKTSRRQLWIEPLTWRDGKPVVEIAESGTLPKGEKP